MSGKSSSKELPVHSSFLDIRDGEKRFECKLCGKKLIRRSSLVPHMNIHLGIKEFECHVCNKRFVQKGNLNVHMKKRHLTDMPFECFVCKRRFMLNKQLERHLASHGKIIYECVLCQENFRDMQSLEMHTDDHIRESKQAPEKDFSELSVRNDKDCIEKNEEEVWSRVSDNTYE
ncbi:zinc finger protein ZFP2-like [Macrobrachium nipponense]|uniref:zinc finger protein ZFP2-like n=1 Tax=Macrobrachium nipponense TaxID=159736 RepID=UPI0030C8C992